MNKHMKRYILVAVAALAWSNLNAAELKWLTDLPKAKALAKTENKTVFLHFTGSDWCGFCKKQQREVFSTKEFADYAKKNLVLVDIDFPRRKSLPPALKKANERLKKEYAVRGFPTVIFLDSQGKKLGQKVGYGGGGPESVIAEVEKARRG